MNTNLIKNYIKLVSEEIGCTLIIYDNFRILRNCDDFGDVPEISHWHTNEYCMTIKETAALHRRCVALKRHFDEKVYKSKGPCYITCYCGVTEIAVPVILNNTLILTVSAAGIMGKISEGMKKILCKRAHLSADEFDTLREDSLVSDIDTNKVETYLETLACLLKVYLEKNVPKEIFNRSILCNEENSKYLKTATDYIDKYFTEDIKVDDVSKACCLSTSHLQHIFIKSTGKGIGDKIRMNRLQYACQLLRTTNRTVKNIAIKSGFKNVDYFSYAFHKEYGITPLKYRKKWM